MFFCQRSDGFEPGSQLVKLSDKDHVINVLGSCQAISGRKQTLVQMFFLNLIIHFYWSYLLLGLKIYIINLPVSEILQYILTNRHTTCSFLIGSSLPNYSLKILLLLIGKFISLSMFIDLDLEFLQNNQFLEVRLFYNSYKFDYNFKQNGIYCVTI